MTLLAMPHPSAAISRVLAWTNPSIPRRSEQRSSAPRPSRILASRRRTTAEKARALRAGEHSHGLLCSPAQRCHLARSSRTRARASTTSTGTATEIRGAEHRARDFRATTPTRDAPGGGRRQATRISTGVGARDFVNIMVKSGGVMSNYQP
eukprot:4104268-Prymnesium_polylepis.1